MPDITTLMMAAAGAGGEESDDDFANTVLLLHGDGTNGAQNNTFLDSSTNNFTITRNGNTTQGSFTPFSKPDGKFGNFFDGSGDYLSSTSVALITNAVTTFTVEAWVYLTATPPSDANNISAFCTLDGQPTGPTNYMSFGPLSSRVLYLRWFDGAAKSATGTTVLSLNTWYHIACVVNSNSIQFYIDGVADAMGGTTTLTNRSGTQGNFAIGSSSAGVITGYISNFRVTTTAVYTAAFTPSGPLTNITNTKILTCQSNRFIDNSTNAYALTANGNVKVTPFSPFPITTEYSPSVNGGSGYFDGSGDYLTVADNASLEFGSGEFSIEMFLYQTASAANATLITKRVNNTTADAFAIINVGGTLTAFFSSSSGSWTIINGVTFGAPTLNAWNHIAVYRVGNAWYGALNGVVTTLNANNSSSVSNNANNIAIGAENNAVSPVTGYISSTRIVVGSSVYTASNFTPPTTPLTAITDTELLCNFTNAGIFDNTCFNNLETVGNAQIDTTTKKYGTGSIEFDGTGDFLQLPVSENLAFGTGNYTVELWVYFTSISAGTLQILYGSGDTGNSFFLSVDADQLSVGTFTAFVSNQATTFTTGVWYHVAACRSGTTLKLFQDGVQVGSDATDTTSWISNNFARIGANPSGAQAVSGYIDDLRITKGIARYTAAFTPPTKAFPNIGE